MPPGAPCSLHCARSPPADCVRLEQPVPLEIYNTLSRSVQSLQPLDPGRVRLYVCGMTMYDYCHLGHARLSSRSTWSSAGCEFG